ncbi:hypothetical protein C9374_001090 [Naegleria lovaniensis]|uniref:D-alanyl-D-alanine carboxypeptidase/D-alanyl-D-alanine-endopeptidase n=1 Tax=Naegleria lovaniensis TaxID=51637 RepID=A0AA88GSD2_NAELO|nr:uncharacterized protein C9374_001090 [Naegleria lovaniensis]KAG2387496.1 hypothetical protein C9374_001090 [Naegleria lovaniensis]
MALHHLRVFICTIATLLLLLSVSIIASASSSRLNSDPILKVCKSEIPNQITSMIENFPATFAIRVVMNQSMELFSYNSDPFFQPASNNKLLTTIAALNQLGSKFRFQTNFYYDYKQKSVVVRPMGDPTLTFEKLQFGLKSVFLQLNSESVEQVIVDNSFFNPIPFTNEGDDNFPSSWEWGNMQYTFSALPSSCSLEHNIINFNVKAGTKVGDYLIATIDDKTFEFATPMIQFDTTYTRTMNCSGGNSNNKQQETVNAFYRPLDRKVIVRGQLCTSSISPQSLTILDPVEFFMQAVQFITNKPVTLMYLSDEQRSNMFAFTKDTIYSDNILHIMNTTLQESDNTYAELFLRQIGALIKPSDNTLIPFPSITQRGIQMVKNILTNTPYNLSPNTFFQDDGSGLSRHNLVSARSLVDALIGVYYKGAGGVGGEVYKSLLPLGGVSGTLKNRFKNFPGLVSAKTGSLDGVSSLSGYIRNERFRDPIIFSIIVNQCPLSASQMHQVIDSIVILYAFMNPDC